MRWLRKLLQNYLLKDAPSGTERSARHTVRRSTTATGSPVQSESKELEKSVWLRLELNSDGRLDLALDERPEKRPADFDTMARCAGAMALVFDQIITTMNTQITESGEDDLLSKFLQVLPDDEEVEQ